MANLRSVGLFLATLLVLRHCDGKSPSGTNADLPKRAVERSQITSPGSRPFLLRAKVVEKTNPSNEKYKAEIEEYWAGPNKWRRIVRTANFTQILVVNAGKATEQLTGDYEPNWLRTIVAAIFEPGDRLQGVDMSRSTDNPMPGSNQFCRRFMYLAGVPPVSNQVFSTYCFEGGLLESIGVPGYDASYENYKSFNNRTVARTIGEYIEPGEELEATIVELRDLPSTDEAQFAVQDAGPLLQTIRVSEEVLRGSTVNASDVAWPTVVSGSKKGTFSLYVCLDRTGRVREIYELNSSNPGLSDIAREQVMKWQFKPPTRDGVAVQVESILTFAFDLDRDH
jgi:hypothetical protein